MKTYEEMAKSVIERRDSYNKKRKRRIRTAVSVSAACCICLSVLAGAAVQKYGLPWQRAELTAEDSTVIGEKDTFDDAEKESVQKDSQNQEPQDGNSPNDSAVNVPQDGIEDGRTDGSGSAAGSAGADVSHHPNNYVPDGSERKMISSYGSGTISGSYAAPANGKSVFSVPLSGAMAEYGDSVMYHVVIDVFENREQLAPDSGSVKAEQERLSAKGYTVAVENYYDGSENHCRFTLHAEYDELKNFAASEDYGYSLSLYDERTE